MTSNASCETVALVVTSIASPHEILQALARGCRQHGYQFIVIGDVASPENFALEGCRFYSLAQQYETGLSLARLSPTKHYARKNLGYLLALRDGASLIRETDDDNIPCENFWKPRERRQRVRVAQSGWTNVYRYFSESEIWPRGFPLEHIKSELPPLESLTTAERDCPIQQGLVNENPDVDAIYRLTGTLPQSFSDNASVALAARSWCPFNSQNTTWWRDAFPLLYLPAYCSFRMTDIWRSFVAQRIAWENDWSILFYAADARQERNEHNLMRDFRDEVPGYLNNERLCDALSNLSLRAGVQHLGENLLTCYEKLVTLDLVSSKELELVAAWLEDFDHIKATLITEV